MAFRGRGRGPGRGRWQGRDTYFMNRMGKHEPFVFFPEDVKLPDVSIFQNMSDEEKVLIHKKIVFQRFFKNSPYYLGDFDKQDAEAEQSNEKFKLKDKELYFGNLMELHPSYFPAELIQGQKKRHVDSNKPLRDTKKDVFSLFEKLEEKMDANGEKTKDIEEESEEESEKEEIESSDDEYTKFEHFDDDEDNISESEPEEDYYE